MQRVSDRVHVEVGYHGSNTAVLDGGFGELVLVDAPQLPTDARHWAEVVAAFGTPRYLVNTDHHPDHTVGNRWLGGTLVAHTGTRQRLASEPPPLEYLLRLFAVLDADAVPMLDGYEPRLPEITFNERLELWVGDRHIELVHAPAHTANTIMAYVPDEGVLFTGDNVCESSLPAFVDSCLHGFFDALDLAASLAFEHLVPGHGRVAGRELLTRYREWGREVIGRVSDARARGASREECGATIRYDDRIHRDLGNGLADYPPDLVDTFQRASIEKIFDELERDPSLRDR